MDELVVRWAIGLVVSLGGGWLAAWGVLKLWRPEEEDQDHGIGVPNWMMGLGERLFFTPVVGLELSGAVVAMMVWLTVKMVTGWNRLTSDDGQRATDGAARTRRAMASLFASLVSMFFALIGGLIGAG